ncbi:uncharacterized protein LOC135937913 [Cloeon dipterum]|uniref:uncharacterized protein LOC135937913 n=1 Tax=Cloeon dipterum TaxID=197152 RepID=UPI00321FF953
MMIRRKWQRVGKTRKFVQVMEVPPWEQDFAHDTIRINPEEEKLKRTAEAIRLRQAGFVRRTKTPNLVINHELLKGKVIYVDSQLVKSEHKEKFLNRKEITEGIVSQLEKMGSTISSSLTKKVNYILFMNGRYSTYQFSQKHSIPMVSSGWIEECKKQNAIASHVKFAAHVPDNFRNPVAPRKYKRTYTVDHLEMLSEKRKKRQKTADDSKKPTNERTVNSKKTEKTDAKKPLTKEKEKSSATSVPRKRGRPKKERKEETKKERKEEKREEAVAPPAMKIPARRPRTRSITQADAECESLPPSAYRPIPKYIAVAGLNAEQHALVTKAVETLKASYLFSGAANEKATHLVWGGGRTVNLLKGIAYGCRIVSFRWIEESIKNGAWLPVCDKFVPKQYAEIDCEIQRQRNRYGALFRCQLLQAMGPIYVNAGVKSCKPEDMKTLVRLCGGTLVHNLQDAKLVLGPPPDKLVLSTTTYVKEQWLYAVICNYRVLPLKPFFYEPNQA